MLMRIVDQPQQQQQQQQIAEEALVRDLVFVLDGSEGRYIHYADTQSLAGPAAAPTATTAAAGVVWW